MGFSGDHGITNRSIRAEERQPVEKKSEKEGERPKSLQFGEERRGSGSFCYTIRGQKDTPPGICKDVKGKELREGAFVRI